VHAPMDDPKWKPGWLEWVVIGALVVVTVIACLILLWPQIAHSFPPHMYNLWLHIGGL
jgi:hypothetical protein